MDLEKAKDFLLRAQAAFKEHLLPDTLECVEYVFKYVRKHMESEGKEFPSELCAKASRLEEFQQFVSRMGNCWCDTINEDPEEVAFLLQTAEEMVLFATTAA